MATEIEQLLRHMAWADALIWPHVVDVAGSSDDERLTELLHHIHSVQTIYLQVFWGEPVDVPEVSTFTSLETLLAWARAVHEDLEGFSSGIGTEATERAVTFPWAEQLQTRFGDAEPVSVRQALLQITSHSTYHRGQASTRIRALGGEPPLTDFVVWVWSGQPAAAWPTVASA